MRTYRLVILSLAALMWGAAAPALAHTVVKNFAVVEADPAWVAAKVRFGSPPSRIGEVITPAASNVYRVGEIALPVSRQDSGFAEIRLPARSSRQGLGEIVFNGRSGRPGIGNVIFKPKSAPGAKGTLRRIGDIPLPGISLLWM